MKDLIKDIIEELFKPKLRSVCVCGNFELGKIDYPYYWCQCKNCGCWASELMIRRGQIGFG